MSGVARPVLQAAFAASFAAHAAVLALIAASPDSGPGGAAGWPGTGSGPALRASLSVGPASPSTFTRAVPDAAGRVAIPAQSARGGERSDAPAARVRWRDVATGRLVARAEPAAKAAPAAAIAPIALFGGGIPVPSPFSILPRSPRWGDPARPAGAAPPDRSAERTDAAAISPRELDEAARRAAIAIGLARMRQNVLAAAAGAGMQIDATPPASAPERPAGTEGTAGVSRHPEAAREPCRPPTESAAADCDGAP